MSFLIRSIQNASPFRTTLALLGVAALPQTAHAQTAAVDFTGFTPNNTAITSTRGFSFNITSSVTVTGLSVFDEGADGLAQSHAVGLWDSGGTLLASTTVPSGTAAPLDSSGKFRYATLSTPVTLPIATAYRVGAVYIVGSADRQATSLTGLTSAPGVTYVGGAVINNGVGSLTFPTSNFASGVLGGSFVIGAASSAPEPRTLVLLALGGVLVTGKRRRAK